MQEHPQIFALLRRAKERFGVGVRDIFVELGKHKVVDGQGEWGLIFLMIQQLKMYKQ